MTKNNKEAMSKVLNVKSVNDYARYVGAEVLHPLVAVVHYDELERCRHSLNHYQVYGIILMQESTYTLSYGQGHYRFSSGSLMCVAPGQTGGVTDNGEIIHIKGWMLLFAPELLQGTDLARRMGDYHFFSYYENESLHATAAQVETIENCMSMLRQELRHGSDSERLRRVVVAYLQLILEYCASFYECQFKDFSQSQNDLLKRFDSLLHGFYDKGLQHTMGLPSVRYCARELCLSPGYFGDLVRQNTGETAIAFIHRHVMGLASHLLLSGQSVTQTAYSLGFDYPQHFTRMFKKHFGLTPTQYVSRRSS